VDGRKIKGSRKDIQTNVICGETLTRLTADSSSECRYPAFKVTQAILADPVRAELNIISSNTIETEGKNFFLNNFIDPQNTIMICSLKQILTITDFISNTSDFWQ
jgi:hypothetical protein